MTQFRNYTDYEIRSNGSVISYKRNNPTELKGQRATQSSKGYRQVRLFNEETPTGKLYYIHRVIWEAFNGEIPSDMEVDHIDNDTSNNDISNLQLLTRRENVKKYNLETFGYNIRDHRDEILADYKLLGTQKAVAEKWGLSCGTVWRVVNKKVNSYKNGKQIVIEYRDKL